MFQDSSIVTKAVIFLILFIAASMAGLYLLLGQINVMQLRNESRSIAGQVVAFRGWVAQTGVVWVKGKETDFLGKYSCNGDTTFFSKNPALATRQLSARFNAQSSRATFRVTSSNYRNPENTPDIFEDDAELQFRNNVDLKEYYVSGKDEFRYAKPLYIKKGCLKCHSDPANAPKEVVEKYGDLRGFGYRLGEVRGVISVTIPTKGMLEATMFEIGPWVLGWIIALIAMVILYTKSVFVKPINQMRKIVAKITAGQPLSIEDSLFVSKDTSNELGKLALAIQNLASRFKRF
jgi:hypothetical protein